MKYRIVKFKFIIVIGFAFLSNIAWSQKAGKSPQYFGDPILTDSLSTIFIPTRYSQELLSANKIALWGNYYSNILVYDYKTDNYKKLFLSDTYVEAFKERQRFRDDIVKDNRLSNITDNWVFLLVKNLDYNENGKIDEDDPSILFVSTIKGEDLKALTTETINVVSIDIYNEQGFGLIKFQRDTNNDKSFKKEDNDFYFKKISLSSLIFGSAIEIK